MEKCRRCDNPVVEGHLCCEYHMQMQRQNNKDRIRSKMENKICIFCNEPAVENRTRCVYHLNQNNKRTQARRKRKSAEGLCSNCGCRQPRPGYKTCSYCSEYISSYHRKRHRERREAGLCTKCGKPVPNGNSTCPLCTPFKGKGGSVRGVVLQRDNFACVVCGEKEFITVHHIDLSGDSEFINNEENNLVVLCRSCHKTIHNLIRRLGREEYLIRMLPIILSPLGFDKVEIF